MGATITLQKSTIPLEQSFAYLRAELEGILGRLQELPESQIVETVDRIVDGFAAAREPDPSDD